jgi:peptidyl-prolyl cis-trans isomerase D
MSNLNMRKKNSPIVWGVMGLLVLGLGGFGVTNFSGGARAIGAVGDRDITIRSYANALRQEMAAFGAQVGMQISFQQAQSVGIDASVRSQLVTMAALDNETERLGVSIGDSRVRDTLLGIAQFRGIDGKFDRDAYAFALKNEGLAEAEFEATVRDETARTLLQGAVVGGVIAPITLVDTLYANAAETRELSFVTLDPAAQAASLPMATPADLQNFYSENPALFTRPEAKRITYAKLMPDMLLDEVTVDEDALRELYDAQIDTFVQAERRLVERLAFASEADALAARARVDAGTASFDDLVAERDLSSADTDIGDVSAQDLGAAADAVFALSAPGIAGPAPSSFGPALYRVNGILAAQETSFDEARPELLREYSSDQARRLIENRMSGIDDLLAGGATLEELVTEAGMILGQIDFYDGSDDEMAAYSAFRAAANALTPDDFPAILTLDDGGIAAMRLDETLPAQLRPFDDVRDQVQDAWDATAITSALMAQAQAMKTALDQGAAPDSLTPPLQNLPAVRRDEGAGQIPQMLVQAGFGMNTGEVQVIDDGQRVHVLRLGAILPAPLPPAEGSAAADLRRRIESQMAQGVAQDVFGLFSTALQNQAGISLDQAAINAVHAQFP